MKAKGLGLGMGSGLLTLSSLLRLILPSIVLHLLPATAADHFSYDGHCSKIRAHSAMHFRSFRTQILPTLATPYSFLFASIHCRTYVEVFIAPLPFFIGLHHIKTMI